MRPTLLPIALTFLGIWMLVGCIYIPTFNAAGDEAKPVAKQVGGERSRKPLRVLHATREDVRRALGPPAAVTTDGRRAVYSWRVRHGYVFWPLCFGGHWHESTRSLELRFDDRGVLKDFAVHRRPGRYHSALPLGVGSKDLRWHDAGDDWPATQPAARPGHQTP